MLTNLFSCFLQWLFNTVWAGIRFSRPCPKTASTSSAPPTLSLGRVVPSLFAHSASSGEAEKELFLTDAEMGRHLAILGAVGVGKTNLLRQIVRALIKQGDANVVIIDARGDLTDCILMLLAHDYSLAALQDRLVCLDLRRTDYSIPLNILAEPGLDPYTRVAFLMEIIDNQWELGVQTSQVLRHCLLTLTLATPPQSFMEIEPLLQNKNFRGRILESIQDPSVLRFWQRYDALPEASRSQWAEPVLNRLGSYLGRPVLRNMFSQQETLSLRNLLETGNKVILVALAMDSLYADAHLTGSVLVTSILSATMRTDRPEAERQRTYLIIDEFANFAKSSNQFAEAVQEGRRFRLGLLLSNQSSGQLEPKLRNLIRNVVGTQIFFSVGGGEAELLAGEIATDEPKAAVKNQLLNLAVGEAIVVRRGKAATCIRTRLCPDPAVTKEAVEALRLQALRRFGYPQAEIEQELAEREAALHRVGSAGTASGTPAPLPADPAMEIRPHEPENPEWPTQPKKRTRKKPVL